MANNGDMRTFTYLFEIKQDGKQVAEIKRSVRDIDNALQKANKAVGENATVTAKQVKNQVEMEKAARRAISESNKLSKSTERVTDYYQRLNVELAKADPNMEVVNAQMRAGVTATSEQGKQIEQLVLEYQRLRNQGDAAQGSMRNFRGVVQNVGWQMQDTVVQLQMGTDAFTVLSQQGSQIASSFGAGGAVLGAVIALGGAIGGVLFKSLIDTADAADKFEEAQDSLNKVIDTGSVAIGAYSDRLVELAKLDAGLAQLQITQGIIEAEEAVDALSGQLQELLESEAVVSGRGRFRAGAVRTQVVSYEKLKEQLGLTYEEAERLHLAQKRFTETKNIEAFRDILVELNETYGKGNEKLNEYAGSLLDIVVNAKTLEEAQEKLLAAQKNLNVVTEESENKGKKQKDSAAELIKEWTHLNATFGLSEEALARYNVTQELVESGQLDQLPVIESLIANYHRLAKARDDQATSAKEAAEREQALSRIQSGQDAVFTANDPYAAEVALFEKNMIELRYLREEAGSDKLAEQQRINNLLQAEEERHAQAMVRITEIQMQSQLMMYGSLLGQLGGLTAQLAAAAEDGSAEAEALFYTSKALAFASTIVNTELAAIKAMAAPDVTLFSQQIPAATAIRGIGYASAGVIAGTTIAGAFDKGGVIPQGQLGIVAEYGDELVDGMLVKGKAGGTRVTSRADTAKILDQADANGGGMTIVQNFNVNGNGDKALAEAMRTAARNGAQEGYAMVAKDFKTGRGIRQTLKRSARV